MKFVILFSCLLPFLGLQVHAQYVPMLRECFNPENYTSNSQFQTNLNVLLRSLRSNGFQDKFFNTSTGNGSDTVYGLVQCIGYESREQCQTCLNNITVEIIRWCPNKKDATIKYGGCNLRYSNQRFFSQGNNRRWALYNTANIIVQCNRDLSPTVCKNCLESMISYIPDCCNSKQGAHIYSTTCDVKFEIYPFVENEPVSPPPVSALPPQNTNNTERGNDEKDDIGREDSLQFDLDTIRTATNGFSDANKLGEGGFGAVYKGTLLDGQEIAVKRLSKNSGQGSQEFKNEVLLLAKLHHRNLVMLLDFCLEGDEKLLIYEFVPNASLDKFLFDPVKRTLLDWDTRYKIIGGIVRGLLYLHEDSRDRIIHRDLKASNVLLDGQMNPKIADFGMARLFVVDQTQTCTSRVVGTYGYMAPEYAMHGQFSVKSDVFSFGVLVLEIISGKRNNSSFSSEGADDLLSYAWRQWQDRTPLELLDPVVRERCSESEVMRCIHIALLCVQEDGARRPTMASVVLTLNSYSVSLALPSSPAFFYGSADRNMDMVLEGSARNTTDSGEWILREQNGTSSTQYSRNDASITELEPR